MRSCVWLFVLLGSFCGALYGEDGAPSLLSDAARCLVTEKQDWLGLNQSKAKSVSFGYIVDTQSYPGEKHLFVVAYTGERKGRVFDIRVETRGQKQRFTIENNATFVQTNKGVSFVEPPLGGVWTQEHLQSAVRRIELGSRVALPTEELRNPSAQIECRCYADQ